MRARVVLSILALLGTCVGTCAFAESPTATTLEAWDVYVKQTEAALGTELKANGQERAAMKAGGLYLRHVDTGDRGAPGIIHHWMAGILIPGAKIKPLWAWMQDYDSH